MAIYKLPTPPPFNPPAANPLELSGEDVLFTDKMQISAGDWQTVSGVDSAEQSVRREASSNIGSMLRRPDWGMGLSQTIFQSATKTLASNTITRVRTRMQQNPRVGKFLSAEIFRLPNNQGSAVAIRYEPVGVKKPSIIVLKGSR